MTDTELRALEAATNAAQSVAARTAATPCEAAMEVVCAFLVAREQLRRANKEADRSLEESSAAAKISEALLTASGFSAPDPLTSRAMTLLGLQPLLRIRQSKDPSRPAPSVPPHPGEARTGVLGRLLRRCR